MKLIAPLLPRMLIAGWTLGLVATVALADCPDVRLKCPTGQTATVGSCFDSWCTCDVLCCPEAGCKLCSGSTAQGTDRCVDAWESEDWRCPGVSVRDRVDGCSALGLTPTMNTYFRVACNIHDICYHTPDKDRATCDAEFRQNMLALCAIPSSESAHCASWAGTAYAAVVAGGQPAYDADQEWYSDHCSVGTPAAGTNWGMVKAVYR